MQMTLHHVALASPKAPEAVDFYSTDWGLHEVGREDGTVRLGASRDVGEDYSLVLVISEKKAVDHFCLVTPERERFDEVRARIEERGVPILEDIPCCPGMTEGFHFVDLEGRRVEFALRTPPAEGPDPAELPDAVPAFLAHIVLNSGNIEKATEWYCDILGFAVREWRAQDMSFLYSNRDHHTVAFNRAPHPSLNHVAWEMPELNQFFRHIGRASRTKTGEKLYGPGRHGPGDYIFCYFLDPMEFICECETDGVKVDDPADFPFRVLEYSKESLDQWMGVLSGGKSPRFREAALGRPDEGLIPTD
ncbi:VOC family protein [Nocardia alni]|uniref:VOC family protein n=1 Tax=Nocardia alni TaxID=2815723 RepID=UPI001C22BB8C|nr:VOC family protein [Nocardia alni]